MSKNRPAQKRPYSFVLWVTLVVGVLLLPLNLLALYTSYISYTTAIDNTRTVVSSTLRTYLYLLQNTVANTNSLFTNLAGNAQYQTLAEQDGTWRYQFARQQVYNEVVEEIRRSDVAQELFMYMEKTRDTLIVASLQENARPVSEGYVATLVERYSARVPRWVLTVSEDGDPIFLRIQYDTERQMHSGAVVSLKPFLARLDESFAYKSFSSFFTMEASRLVISDTPSSVATDVSRSPTVLTDASQTAGQTHGKLLLCSAQINKGFPTLCATIETREVTGAIGFWQRRVLIVFALYLALSPVFLLLFLRYLKTPLQALRTANEELKQGNDTYHITEKAQFSEFYDAFESYNSMVDAVKDLKEENLRTAVENRELQIEYLQLQIRPHFLLNTFNLIYTLIKQRKPEPAGELILYLSDYFRYMFKKTNKLEPFSKELALINKYLDVSKIYYPSGFTVTEEIDPVLGYLEVPPLLFHSFVENIIQHGLVQNRVVHIMLAGEYEDGGESATSAGGTATFYIADDGKGMPQSDVDAINAFSAEVAESGAAGAGKTSTGAGANAVAPGGKHVGIRNSIKRLHYFYRARAKVTVESEEGVGTTFTITIPCNLDAYLDEQLLDEAPGTGAGGELGPPEPQEQGGRT